MSTDATSYNAPLAMAPAASYSTVLCVTPEQLARAMKIRHRVFVEEQGYDAAIEVDGLSFAFHGRAIGGLRADGRASTGWTRCAITCS